MGVTKTLHPPAATPDPQILEPSVTPSWVSQTWSGPESEARWSSKSRIPSCRLSHHLHWQIKVFRNKHGQASNTTLPAFIFDTNTFSDFDPIYRAICESKQCLVSGWAVLVFSPHSGVSRECWLAHSYFGDPLGISTSIVSLMTIDFVLVFFAVVKDK